MPTKKRTATTRRQPLTRSRIIKAALDIADKNGIAELSMRNVAAALGVEAMSLYNHVANKDEILNGLVDFILDQIERPALDTHWREAMRLRALSARGIIMKHPWASLLIESRTAPSDARMRYADEVITFLKNGGFNIEMQHRAFLLIDSYVYGFVLQTSSWPTRQADRKRIIAGLKEFIKQGQFENLMRMIHNFATIEPAAGKKAYDTEFAFGLDIILDGLERQLANSFLA